MPDPRFQAKNKNKKGPRSRTDSARRHPQDFEPRAQQRRAGWRRRARQGAGTVWLHRGAAHALCALTRRQNIPCNGSTFERAPSCVHVGARSPVCHPQTAPTNLNPPPLGMQQLGALF